MQSSIKRKTYSINFSSSQRDSIVTTNHLNYTYYFIDHKEEGFLQIPNKVITLTIFGKSSISLQELKKDVRGRNHHSI